MVINFGLSFHLAASGPC